MVLWIVVRASLPDTEQSSSWVLKRHEHDRQIQECDENLKGAALFNAKTKVSRFIQTDNACPSDHIIYGITKYYS